MRLVFHPLVAADVSQIMEQYAEIGGEKLADEFYTELRFFLRRAALAPEAYALRENDLRRVNLERFPYHFLFRISRETVRVLVVRHHKRRPSLAAARR